jgi:DNA-binding response OmpR family regulator
MRHVLVVDDDPAICEMLEEALNQDGRFRVSCAQTIEEARERIAADRPDTVVLDVILTGASGLELRRELVEQKLPVLLMSASPGTMNESALKGLPCLAKPFRVREFMVWLSEATDA